MKISAIQDSPQQSWIRVYTLIEEMLFTDLSIRYLSDQLCTSHYHLQHQFCFPTGESIWQIVKRMRLEHAFGLLKHSNYSIGEIGEIVGYHTKNSFAKAFRQHFNLAPIHARAKLDMIPDNCMGSFSPAISIPVNFRDVTIQKFEERSFFFRYYDPLSMLKYGFKDFKECKDPKHFLTEYDSSEVAILRYQSSGLDSVIEMNTLWNNPIYFTSTYVVSATLMGTNLVRAGFMLSQHEQSKRNVLRQLGFMEFKFPAGKFMCFKSSRPLSYTGIESFEIIHEAVKQGYYALRSNDILVKASNIYSRQSEIQISIC